MKGEELIKKFEKKISALERAVNALESVACDLSHQELSDSEINELKYLLEKLRLCKSLVGETSGDLHYRFIYSKDNSELDDIWARIYSVTVAPNGDKPFTLSMGK